MPKNKKGLADMLNINEIEAAITLKETFSLLQFMAKDKEIKVNSLVKGIATRLNKKGIEVVRSTNTILSNDERAILNYVNSCIEIFVKYNMIKTGIAYVGARFKNTKTTKTIKLTTKGAAVKC